MIPCIRNEFHSMEVPLELKHLHDLDVGKLHKITDMRFLHTKYGKQLFAIINKRFAVCLPDQTFRFLYDRLHLFNQMMDRVRDNRLGLQCLVGNSNRFEFIELFPMKLSELNEISKMEILLPSMELSILNVGTIYRVTGMLFTGAKNERRIVADIENKFAVIIPKRTYQFLNTHKYLFTQMALRAQSCGLGLRSLSYSIGIEFIELLPMDLTELNKINRMDPIVPSGSNQIVPDIK